MVVRKILDLSAPSKTPKTLQDLWCTPPTGWDFVVSVLGRTFVDPCASRYPDRQAASINWSANGLRPWADHRVYMNPPYSAIWNWTLRAQSRPFGITLALLPARTDSAWWYDHVRFADRIWLPRGRIRFLHPVTGQPAGQPRFGSVWVLWIGQNEHSGLRRECVRRFDACVRSREGWSLKPLGPQ